MMFFVNRLVTLVKCFNRAKADQPWDFTISHYRMVTKLKIMEVMIMISEKKFVNFVIGVYLDSDS